MSVTIDRPGAAPIFDAPRSPRQIEIGLVNNMPDTALEATERQFIALIEEAAPDLAVRLKLYSLPEVTRGERAAAHMKDRYRPIDALSHAALDALIVTGAEPRAPDLREEPYWRRLTQIVDWAQANTTSTIFSCLAAHAAVLHLDGIARRPLGRKLFGVFAEETAAAHAFTCDLDLIATPHSRWNELREAHLAAAGYTILTRSREAGVGMFAKQQDSLLLFIQGHPEYEAETLLREYRRDIGRYLRGEREGFPGRPRHYFGPRASDRIKAYRDRAIILRDRDYLAEFPIFELRRAVRHVWRPGAVALYRNWLGLLERGKPRRLAARLARVETAIR
ncbi:MAG: homoserine O-succinyltransferase MetA [Stellaceae bacterium]